MIDSHRILNLLPGGILIIDNKQKVVFANTWILNNTGHSENEIRTISLSNILITTSTLDFTENTNGLLQSAQLIHQSGSQLPVYISASNITEENQQVTILCVFTNKNIVQNKENISNKILERDHYFGLVGKSPGMQEVYGFIELAAETDSNVVIQGESGTGKELVASAIHNASNRKDKQFVKVNCAALTETLLESELFGHTKGAFTGAYRDHEGKFEFADKGTIFLDEIGEITSSMQVKLLRVLQERLITRVGDNREIRVNVRVIVATNKNLRSLVSKGKFREDLFYRLNVFPIHMPALRERKTDVSMLIDFFMRRFRERTGKPIQTCSADAMRILMAYCWPGNVRELENTIEHAFILGRTDEIQVVDLPHELRVSAVREGICAEKIAGIRQTIYPLHAHIQNNSARSAITKESIEEELLRQNGNKTAAARVLGISKVGLWKKMKKLEMI
jgi:transcriptional regulator with PAS, ATPase and Fis domain